MIDGTKTLIGCPIPEEHETSPKLDGTRRGMDAARTYSKLVCTPCIQSFPWGHGPFRTIVCASRWLSVPPVLLGNQSRLITPDPQDNIPSESAPRKYSEWWFTRSLGPISSAATRLGLPHLGRSPPPGHWAAWEWANGRVRLSMAPAPASCHKLTISTYAGRHSSLPSFDPVWCRHALDQKQPTFRA